MTRHDRILDTVFKYIFKLNLGIERDIFHGSFIYTQTDLLLLAHSRYHLIYGTDLQDKNDVVELAV